MVNVAWPAKLQPQSFHNFHIDADTSGGGSLGGNEQFVASPGSRWGAEMSVPIFDKEGVLAMRALRSKLDGGANPIILPNFDGQRQSWPVEAETGRVLTPRVAHWLDGTRGLEGTAYAGADIPASAQISGTVTTTAALGATQVSLTMTQGGPLLAGQQFGVFNLRIHEISEIVSVVGAVTKVNFRPRFRSQVVAGTPIQFTRPKCLMWCRNLNDQAKLLELMRFTTLELEFVEYL
jgi:hypothetical protein